MPLLRRLLGGSEERSRGRRMGRLDGRNTSAGVPVTPEGAMQVAAVFSCVRLLAESGSGLPISALQRTSTGRTPADDHPAAHLLHEPNPNMDGEEYRRLTLAFQALRGNAFGYIERQNSGLAYRVWPVRPTSVAGARLATGELAYDIELADDEYAPLRGVTIGTKTRVARENVLHYRALGLGDFGLSPIALARQSVGTSWAAQAYVGGFFDRDASPGGVIKVPGTLSDTAFERLTSKWSELHEGFDNSHRLEILEGGASWEKVGLAPADAAFLDIYKLGRADIAGMYNIPPFMIGSEGATTWGSGIEQMSLGYVIYALAPYLRRFEQETSRLFGPRASGFYTRINTKALLRGDTPARFAAYATARQWGWMSVNDVRTAEDEAGIGDPGDEYLQPMNMQPAGSAAPPAARAAEIREGQAPVPAGYRAARRVRIAQLTEKFPAHLTAAREALQDYFEEQRDEVIGELGARRSRDAAAAALEAGAEVWNTRLAEVLLRLALGVAADVGPAIAAPLGGVFSLDLMRGFFEDESFFAADAINRTTRENVAKRLSDPDTDPLDALTDLFEGYINGRAEQLADARTAKAGNVAALESGRQAGATEKVWVARGQSRASHRAADGQRIDIDEMFRIGSRRGRYPRDSRLGVNEIAGCDCEMDLIKEDES